MKKWKQCPLFAALVVSAILIAFVGLVEQSGAYHIYREQNPGMSAVSMVMRGISEKVYPWSEKKPVGESIAVNAPVGTEQLVSTETSDDTEAIASTEEPEPVADDRTYSFTDVTQDYFDDAVFIGDSRTVGLHDYSGWDNTTYYANIGMDVYHLFDTPVTLDDGSEITIEDALHQRQFAKIYLMIGINEMGTGTVDSFMEAYQGAVAHLQELQPDAIIFVEGIMYVKKEKSDTDPIFNNPGIKERNDRIAQLADNKKIFYIDVNEVVTDETGNLNPEYTYDDIHLLGKYYYVWTDFLLKHGIVKE